MKYLYITSLIVNSFIVLAQKSISGEQNITVLSSDGIEVAANLPSDVIDAELVCYNVMPNEIAKYRAMSEDCEEINATEKSCYVKTQSTDKSLFSTIKYRTGRSCDVYTKKAGVTTVAPTSTKTVPDTKPTILSSDGIEIAADLPSDVVDAELVCYNVMPNEIAKFRAMSEDCKEINATEKSCYVKTQSTDKSLFSTIKYRTGRSCDVYTKKAGVTTIAPTSTKKTSITKTKTITVTGSTKPTNVPTKCASRYAQCGGEGFKGPTCCQSGLKCHKLNKYYSQCL